MTTTPLMGVLQNTSLHSLLLLVSKALTREGFGETVILDRRQPRQNSRYGGHEMECLLRVGEFNCKAIVKVVRDSVRQRNIDEMAGTVLRTRADLGLIISPFHITRKAKANLTRFKNVRIEVLDGSAFADRLAKHNIGVREKGSVDYAFFEALEEAAEKLQAFLRGSLL